MIDDGYVLRVRAVPQFKATHFEFLWIKDGNRFGWSNRIPWQVFELTRSVEDVMDELFERFEDAMDGVFIWKRPEM